MKKAFLIIALCVCVLQLKAQTITGLDEIALLGEWSVNGNMGFIQSLGSNRPKKITFNDGRNIYIEYRENEVPAQYTTFAGYWIGGTATGKYTLHLLSRFDYDSGFTGLSMVNFVITNFTGSEMTLQTYDGSCWLELVKDNSGVESVGADAPEAKATIYNLNGVVVKNPTAPGIYIQGDGKKIVKQGL